MQHTECRLGQPIWYWYGRRRPLIKQKPSWNLLLKWAKICMRHQYISLISNMWASPYRNEFLWYFDQRSHKSTCPSVHSKFSDIRVIKATSEGHDPTTHTRKDKYVVARPMLNKLFCRKSRMRKCYLYENQRGKTCKGKSRKKAARKFLCIKHDELKELFKYYPFKKGHAR